MARSPPRTSDGLKEFACASGHELPPGEANEHDDITFFVETVERRRLLRVRLELPERELRQKPPQAATATNSQYATTGTFSSIVESQPALNTTKCQCFHLDLQSVWARRYDGRAIQRYGRAWGLEARVRGTRRAISYAGKLSHYRPPAKLPAQ